MSIENQPAKVSYFFDQGYKDVRNTIVQAWKNNAKSIIKCKDRIADSWYADGIFKKFISIVLNVPAIVFIAIIGSIITAIITLINIVIVVVVMVVIFIIFSIVWLIDRLYLKQKSIFTACHECKERSLIPTYVCPKCGAKHSKLVPSRYGIFHRVCIGEDPSKKCSQKLPTTFFNGRRDLPSKCPKCDVPLSSRESVPICIPVVGGRSVGKTAFITAFSKQFFDEVVSDKGWETDFYNDDKMKIYNEITSDYNSGSTRMTERQADAAKASSVSFSFFVKGKAFNPERLIHVYDIAGEVFTDNNENEVQKQYEYCQGIVLIIDPFAIPSIRYKYEEKLEPEDVNGIGEADINEIIDTFLNKLREVTGLTDKKMSSVPVAVIISKIDSADLYKQIGDPAIQKLLSQNKEKLENYYDAQDFLCRKFLKDNEMEGFLNNVDIKFKNNRYFSCSAIGHTRDKGKYVPQGVLAPMQWLFSYADNKMRREWNTFKFSKRIPDYKKLDIVCDDEFEDDSELISDNKKSNGNNGTSDNNNHDTSKESSSENESEESTVNVEKVKR